MDEYVETWNGYEVHGTADAVDGSAWYALPELPRPLDAEVLPVHYRTRAAVRRAIDASYEELPGGAS